MKNRLDAYRIFYETARCASFSTAARELYISQSAISQSIHQLEKSLDTRLFVRSRRGITLTHEGELLFRKVETAISALEQGETLLARLHHLSEGSLIIAAGDTITSQYLLPYLERFHATYPGIRIEMANSYSEDMLQRVREGKADLAFVNLPVTDEDLCIEPCLTVHDIFVCGPEEEEKESYFWAEIAEYPLILLGKKLHLSKLHRCPLCGARYPAASADRDRGLRSAHPVCLHPSRRFLRHRGIHQKSPRQGHRPQDKPAAAHSAPRHRLCLPARGGAFLRCGGISFPHSRGFTADEAQVPVCRGTVHRGVDPQELCNSPSILIL